MLHDHSVCQSLIVSALLVFCSVGLSPAFGTQQGQMGAPAKIEGIVVDQAGAVVADAEVSLASQSLNQKTITDSNGRFRFESVAATKFSLSVAAKGFPLIERKIDLSIEASTNLRIVLVPAPISEQVTISATRTPTRISETAASVVVLGAEELKSTAAATLDDALRQVPGFSLFRRSGSRTANPTTMGVSLRGLGASGASRAVVLADGIPLNDPFGGWVYWNRVPRESISEVEILRGGASHLYGSGALGGVVNISTNSVNTNSL